MKIRAGTEEAQKPQWIPGELGLIWEEKKIKQILTGLCFLGGQTVNFPKFSMVLEKKNKGSIIVDFGTFRTGSWRLLLNTLHSSFPLQASPVHWLLIHGSYGNGPNPQSFPEPGSTPGTWAGTWRVLVPV
jgi:hypothetical protein